MVEATLIDKITNIGGRYGDRGSISTLFTFAISDIPKSSSQSVKFKLEERLGLENVKIYCESTNYILQLYNKENLYGFNKLLQKEAINKWLYFESHEDVGSLIIINRDQPQQPYLYGIITNNDAINNTGIISIEFLISSV